jgi:hypothetical protein
LRREWQTGDDPDFTIRPERYDNEVQYCKEKPLKWIFEVPERATPKKTLKCGAIHNAFHIYIKEMLATRYISLLNDSVCS